MVIGGIYMLLNPINYNNPEYRARQPIAGIIIVGLIYPITDILIQIKAKRK